MNLSMYDDRILVEPISEGETVSAGGILLPEKEKSKSQRVKVLAVGPGEWNTETHKHEPMVTCVGDTVLIPTYSGYVFEDNGQEYRVVSETEILGKVMG